LSSRSKKGRVKPDVERFRDCDPGFLKLAVNCCVAESGIWPFLGIFETGYRLVRLSA